MHTHVVQWVLLLGIATPHMTFYEQRLFIVAREEIVRLFDADPE